MLLPECPQHAHEQTRSYRFRHSVCKLATVNLPLQWLTLAICCVSYALVKAYGGCPNM